MKKIYLIALSFCALSCTEDNNSELIEPDVSESLIAFQNFPSEISLKGKNIGPKEFFMNPLTCLYSEGKILVIDDKMENYFHLLNENKSVIHSFGKKGTGPNEISYSPIVSKHNFMSLGAFFYYDYNTGRIEKWKLDSNGITKDGGREYYDLPETYYNVQNLLVLNNEKAVGYGGMPDGKLYFFDMKNKSNIKITKFLPQLRFQPDEESLMFDFSGRIASSSKNNIIVCANNRLPQIEIYDHDGNAIREIRYGKLPSNLKELKSKMYYYSIDVTDNYIYALYLGIDRKNIILQFVSRMIPEIHVFELDGTPVKKIKLDRLINGMTVDEKSKTIIATDDGNESQPLVQFDIPLN